VEYLFGSKAGHRPRERGGETPKDFSKNIPQDIVRARSELRDHPRNEAWEEAPFLRRVGARLKHGIEERCNNTLQGKRAGGVPGLELIQHGESLRIDGGDRPGENGRDQPLFGSAH